MHADGQTEFHRTGDVFLVIRVGRYFHDNLCADTFQMQNRNNTSHELHLIGVAEVHYWHGFDRLVNGLAEYYPCEVLFRFCFSGIASKSIPLEMRIVFPPKILPALEKVMKSIGAKVVMEIPTYPYDQEYITRSMKLSLAVDRPCQ